MELVTKEEQFRPVVRSEQNQEIIVRPSISFWADVWRRLKLNKLTMFGFILLLAVVVLAIIGPWLQPHYNYYTQNNKFSDLDPSLAHWFGTDDFGRDLWVRLWVGARISLGIGLFAGLLDLFFGAVYGGVAAYFGGRVDDIMMRIIEVLYSIPYLLVAILLIILLGSGFWTMVLAYAVTGWIGMARVVRGQVLSLKEQEYVLAAKTLGASPARIILKHLLPNALGVIIINISFSIPSAILTEAFLAFLGLGIKPPLASLGTVMTDGVEIMRSHPFELAIPSAIFALLLLSFNLIGDGLRDALDPKMRK